MDDGKTQRRKQWQVRKGEHAVIHQSHLSHAEIVGNRILRGVEKVLELECW
jgi:hypothetical protein